MTIKVLQVYKDFYPVLGGCENHVRILSQEMVKRGDIEVTVVVTNLHRKTIVEDFAGVKVIKASRLAAVASTPISLSIFGEVRKQKPDITHLHFPYPIGELAYLLGKPGRRLVVTYHSDIVRQKNLLRLYEPFLWRVLARADAIIVESPDYIASSKYLAPFKDKCTVIPTGSNVAWLDSFDPAQVQTIRDKYGSPTLIFVGRFRYYKGVHFLLSAMKNVEAKLLLVGKGPQEAELRAQVERDGLQGKVVFLGELTNADLPNYYRASDVYVLPACERSESFGISMIEGMICGLPAVCTELGTGTTYVNLRDTTGLVVPPRDPDALAEALRRLIADEDLRLRMAAAARERARREFSMETWVERTADVYYRVLNT